MHGNLLARVTIVPEYSPNGCLDLWGAYGLSTMRGQPRSSVGASGAAEDATPLSARLIPGDRVQLDTCKIAPGCYQYTAVDDCTRYRVLGIFHRRTAASTVAFLERLLEEMPCPVQRIQADRG